MEQPDLFSIEREDKKDCIPAACLSDLPEAGKKEYWASLILRHAKGLGIRAQNRLLRRYGTAQSALNDVSGWKLAGLSQECIKAVRAPQCHADAQKEWENADNPAIKIILKNSIYYPPLLNALPDAPIILYCLGDCYLLKSPIIGIVGSRHASSRSQEVADRLAGNLSAKGITIASGMAYGIDRAAHAAALKNIGSSIGVLGTGILRIYPPGNRDLFEFMAQSGLLVSELAPNAPPVPYNFPIRNRIISGLSLGIIVVQAAERSGSLVTARLALEQNREVFAVPGQTFETDSIGCQNLIRQGAHPVFNVEDVMCELAQQLRAYCYSFFPPDLKTQPIAKSSQACSTADGAFFSKHEKDIQAQDMASSPNASMPVDEPVSSDFMPVAGDDCEKIISCLRQMGEMCKDRLIEVLGLSPQAINSSLIMLEIDQKIKILPGDKIVAQ